MDHNARIIVSSDPKGIQDTVTQLEKVGKVDKTNADQFKKHHEEHKKRTHESVDLNTKLSRSLEDLAEGVVAAFAVERVIEFGKECITAFEEAEKATNELRFAVKNLAGGTDASFTELMEQSEKLSSSLNNLFTPKQIQQSQALLLRMKFSTEQVAELLPRISDIAAKTGKDLNSVAEGFGRAISEGNTKALTEFGLKFKDTGTIVGNFNHVMESSKKFIGGAADAMNDYGNQEKEASNKAEILQEAIGSKLAPAWLAIKNGILEGVDAELSFFGQMYDNLTGKAGHNWTELGLAFVNAIFPAATGRGEKRLSEADKFQKLSIEQQQKYLDELKVQAGSEDEIERILAIGKLKELKKFYDKKSDVAKEAEAAHVVDLKKLSDKELESRLDAAKNEDQVIGKFTTSGFAKEAARVQKEIDLRKKGGEELKKLRDKQHKEEIESWRLQQTEIKKVIDEMIKDMEDKTKVEGEINDLLLKKEEQTNEAILESQKLALKKKFDAGKITQEEYDKQSKELENKSRVENDRLELDTLKENNKHKAELLKKERDMNIISEEEYQKKLLEMEVEQTDKEIQLQKDINKSTFELKNEQKEITKKLIESIHELTVDILEGVTESIQSSIEAIDTQAERQNKMIDVQKVLAEKGLANDLAFEERRADELEKKKLEEQKKLRKAKELETFLNSLAKYAEENPNTAIAKALGVLAASKAVEAIYMEEGGIMGQTGSKSSYGLGSFSRRHRSGNDLLIHGERGEGVIPVNKMREWGLTDNGMFSNFLRNPFSTMAIPERKSIHINNNAEVVARLESLEQTIKNKPDFFMDVNQLNEWVTKEVKSGVTTLTTHKRKGI